MTAREGGSHQARNIFENTSIDRDDFQLMLQGHSDTVFEKGYGALGIAICRNKEKVHVVQRKHGITKM
jgi:hypothetical protein